MALIAHTPAVLRRTQLSTLKCIYRSIKMIESGEIVYAKPPSFDYISKPFSLIRSIRDPTYARLNENSKVIVVEGNIGCGKSFLAAKLAEHFGMNYFPDITEDDIYVFKDCNPAFDLRCHNAILPDDAKYYTCEMFWNEPDLINKGKPLYLQLQFYIRRHLKYLKGLCTLFNTGRGFITDRSPFSEIAWSDAFLKAGYMSDRASRWFNQHHGITSQRLWKPHLVIYVKATNQQIRDHFKKRNLPWEMNGINLTDKFLDTYTKMLENSYLARMSRYSEIMVIDGSTMDVYDENDIRIIAQKITEMNFSGAHLLRDDYKFLEWRMGLFNDRAKINVRAKFSDAGRSFSKQFQKIDPPKDMYECVYSYDAREHQVRLLYMDPRTKYPPSFNTRYNNLLNIMFNPFLVEGNFARDLPRQFLWF
ncbi:hypothetical protein X801_05316 [Opisthorchis viverrini]|uniref:Uncharacterized protein n=2 Tax=Opisthorchis viverrini TaxID=6198 RepID=A0A1S8WWJ3_OPIVI|nr:hypothetical protein T265_07402 [Opisthorchis viverrini]KER25065.1 hypothetical protein T265_07402 [Opisthorchis viverrini]OON18826.1 hypothetical protein X801_05316 [Opisthorchis viverrini]